MVSCSFLGRWGVTYCLKEAYALLLLQCMGFVQVLRAMLQWRSSACILPLAPAHCIAAHL